MSEQALDFRGKLLIDESYSRGSQFVEQLPIEDLLPELEEVFAKGVVAIKWNQYVPGWNDGDACEFTINDVLYTSNPAIAALWVEDKRADSAEDLYPDLDYLEDYCFITGSGHPDGLGTHVDASIGSAAFEYALRAEFGDNVTVVITPDSTYKFDYECGY